MRRLAAAARSALAAWDLEDARLRLVQHFHNTVFKVDGEYALRVARPGYQSDAALRSEVEFLEYLEAGDVPAIVPVRTTGGDPFTVVDGRRFLLFRWIEGRSVRASYGRRHARAMGELAGRLHRRSADFVPPPGFERPTLDADSLSGPATGFPRELVRSRLDRAALQVIDEATEMVRATWAELDERLIVHGDLDVYNTLWVDGRPALLDFDDMAWAPPAYDLAVSRGDLVDRDDVEGLWRELREGYSSVRELPEGLDTHLDGLLAGRFVLVILWLAGNQGHPSFVGTGRYVEEAVSELRRIVSGRR